MDVAKVEEYLGKFISNINYLPHFSKIFWRNRFSQLTRTWTTKLSKINGCIFCSCCQSPRKSLLIT